MFSKIMSGTTSKRKSTTIHEIRGYLAPKSPRKISEKLTCAVVNKSELRPTRNGTMFSMNLCDESSQSTLRAVCFNENIFPKFEATKTYEISSFKIKKAFAGGESVEMLLDRELSVVPATTHIPIVGRSNVKIREILVHGNTTSRFINLKAKVMKIHDPYEVGTLPDTKTKRDIVLADETGHINFILWRQRAEKINFKTGDVLSLENVVVSTFNNEINVTTSFETTVKVVDEAIAVKEAADSFDSVSEITTTVLAMKNFKCAYRCFLCKAYITSQSCLETTITTDCPSCGGSFLTRLAHVTNQCLVMLSSDNKWYTANTSVILKLFNWSDAKLQPNECDKVVLLTSKYSLRINVEKRMIEHAIQVEEDEFPEVDLENVNFFEEGAAELPDEKSKTD